MMLPSELDAVSDLVRFLDASPTPYHAVRETRRRLTEGGFRELDERDEWNVRPGDRVFVTRGGGTLLAFVLGAAPPSRSGFVLVGAHTDSPNLRLKPLAEAVAAGQRQLGVEVYGSPLLHTWLDRDLGIAGRVSLLDGSTHLVRIDRPICRISSLAIHLSPTLATEGLRLNPQTHLVPAFGLAQSGSSDERKRFGDLLAAELRASGAPDATADGILAYDLALFDVQGACIGGADGELLYSARLDNLTSCHAAVSALLANAGAGDTTRGILLHDHEEVGSQSAIGAGSLFVRSVLERVAGAYPDSGRDGTARALSRSLFVSADMAHAVHPNHADKHDAQHAPKLGGGPVIKVNSSQSYATDAPGAALFERACRDANVPSQRFVARNDMRCGSTIGPITAARLGVRSIDVGNPMLSMHSCREVCGTADVAKMIHALTRLFASAAVPPAAV
jgi:aspartyl aminopeptidase